MDTVVKLIGIDKTYTRKIGETIALKDINLSIKKNEFICIIGPSGCGKSTLLNIISGLDKNYDGKVKKYINNIKIGYMLQEDCLFDWLNIRENALLGLKISRKKTKENIEYVDYLIKKYGLEEFKNQYPKNLSGGMKQRVALIRTLAIKPDILLMDEPFSALDYQSRLKVSSDVYNIIKNEGICVIMVTHDIPEAIALSNKIVVLSKRPGTIKKIYKIRLSKLKSPIEKRKDKKFLEYYDLLWKDIDKDE